MSLSRARPPVVRTAHAKALNTHVCHGRSPPNPCGVQSPYDLSRTSALRHAAPQRVMCVFAAPHRRTPRLCPRSLHPTDGYTFPAHLREKLLFVTNLRDFPTIRRKLGAGITAHGMKGGKVRGGEGSGGLA
jgi:hypothetical protein